MVFGAGRYVLDFKFFICEELLCPIINWLYCPKKKLAKFPVVIIHCLSALVSLLGVVELIIAIVMDRLITLAIPGIVGGSGNVGLQWNNQGGRVLS